jgi:hypothetical protein
MLQQTGQRRASFANSQELDPDTVTQTAVRRHDARHDRARGQWDALADHAQGHIDLGSRDDWDRGPQKQAADADVDGGTEDRELLAFEPALAAQCVPLVAPTLGSRRWLLVHELWEHAGGTFVEPEARRRIRRMQAHVT